MEVEVIRSRRKTLSAQIREGRVVVRAPLRTTDAEIRQFLEKHRRWLEKHLAKAREMEESKANLRRLTPEDIRALKKQARKVIPERAAYYAPLIGVTYGRISIRCQKTRWGSCSAKGNLNFNCLLMLCPEDVLDYVIVHELCHRKELNHSPRFWAEVEKVLPDYKQPLKWLKTEGQAIIGQIQNSELKEHRSVRHNYEL